MHDESKPTDTTIELAPAAGAGIGKAIASELLSRDGFTKRLADALDSALVATRRTWDAGSKSWQEEPDTRSQLQAAFGIMAHMEGEPVKRIIHQHLGAGGQLDIMGALRESPALLAAAEREIEKAKFRASGRKQKKAEPAGQVEIEEPK